MLRRCVVTLSVIFCLVATNGCNPDPQQAVQKQSVTSSQDQLRQTYQAELKTYVKLFYEWKKAGRQSDIAHSESVSTDGSDIEFKDKLRNYQTKTKDALENYKDAGQQLDTQRKVVKALADKLGVDWEEDADEMMGTTREKVRQEMLESAKQWQEELPADLQNLDPQILEAMKKEPNLDPKIREAIEAALKKDRNKE